MDEQSHQQSCSGLCVTKSDLPSLVRFTPPSHLGLCGLRVRALVGSISGIDAGILTVRGVKLPKRKTSGRVNEKEKVHGDRV